MTGVLSHHVLGDLLDSNRKLDYPLQVCDTHTKLVSHQLSHFALTTALGKAHSRFILMK